MTKQAIRIVDYPLIAVGVLVLGAGGLYVVKLRRG
jgi:hypothetical protein